MPKVEDGSTNTTGNADPGSNAGSSPEGTNAAGSSASASVETGATSASTAASAGEGTTGKEKQKDPIPYDRFHEVNEEKNSLKNKTEQYERELSAARQEMEELRRSMEAPKTPEEAPNFFADPERAVDNKLNKAMKPLDERLQRIDASTAEKEIVSRWESSPELKKVYSDYKDLNKELCRVAAENGFRGKFLTADVIRGAYLLLRERDSDKLFKAARDLGAEAERSNRTAINSQNANLSSQGKEGATRTSGLTEQEKKVAASFGMTEEAYAKRKSEVTR